MYTREELMVVQLSTQDIADLKSQGFSDSEINKAVGEIEKEDLQIQAGSRGDNKTNYGQQSSFSQKGMNMSDVARWQLELNDLLEQAEHILKGDIVGYENNKRIWKSNPKPEKNSLNEDGVRLIMLDLQNYVNRHIILGDYDKEEINKIVLEYGKKLNDLVFMKYEKMGMDTEEKRKEYRSIVLNVTNLVYASYKRALDGGERRSLREMINVNQNQTTGVGSGVVVNAGQQQKVRGILNPMRYVAGKYV